jgi:TorA maturation chaperone TorD
MPAAAVDPGLKSDRALARSVAYAYLAACLRDSEPVEEDLLRDRKTGVVLAGAVRALDPEDRRGLSAAFVRLLRRARRTPPPTRREERSRLFGHAVRGPCPAYEIEYGDDHFLGQARRLSDLSAFYHAFGVRPRQEARERADHVAMEAEFLSFLAYKEARAVEAGRAENAETCRVAAGRFLEDHFGRFLPALSRRASEQAPGGFVDAALEFGAVLAAAHAEEAGATIGRSDLSLRALGPADEETRVSCSGGDPLQPGRPPSCGAGEEPGAEV